MDDNNDMPINGGDDGGGGRGDVRCDVRGDAGDGGVCARSSSKKMRVA